MGFFANLFGIESRTAAQVLEGFIECESSGAWHQWNGWRDNNREAPLQFHHWQPKIKDLEMFNLAGGDFTGANFSTLNLNSVDFTGAVLVDANFVGTNLRNANFQDSICDRATFSGAILDGVNFKGVNLQTAQGLNAFPIVETRFIDAKLPAPLIEELCQLIRKHCS